MEVFAPPTAPAKAPSPEASELRRLGARLDVLAAERRTARTLAIVGYAAALPFAFFAFDWAVHNSFTFEDHGDNTGPGPKVLAAHAFASLSLGISATLWLSSVRRRQRDREYEYRQLWRRQRALELSPVLHLNAAGLHARLRF